MNEQQKRVIRRSWRVIVRIDPILVGDVFYSRLFGAHPELRRFFPGTLHEQYKKLIDMFSMLIACLDNTVEMEESIRGMAKRHQKFQPTKAHFNAIGEAWLWTLKRAMGTEWDQDMEEAWNIFYIYISSRMIQHLSS